MPQAPLHLRVSSQSKMGVGVRRTFADLLKVMLLVCYDREWQHYLRIEGLDCRRYQS